MSKPDGGQRIPEPKKVQDYCGTHPPDDDCTCSVCNYAIDNGFSVTIKKKEVKR